MKNRGIKDVKRLERNIDSEWMIDKSIVIGYASIAVKDSPESIIQQAIAIPIAQHIVDVHNEFIKRK